MQYLKSEQFLFSSPFLLFSVFKISGVCYVFYIVIFSSCPWIMVYVASHLTTTVSDFISDFNRSIPKNGQIMSLFLIQMLSNVSFLFMPKEDKIFWHSTTSGELSLKDGYSHTSSAWHNISWAKVICNQDIPPSKSLHAWRLMQDIIPTRA